MYSVERSFEILAFEFWLYEGVPESQWKQRDHDLFLTDISDEDRDYIFDPDSPTLLQKK